MANDVFSIKNNLTVEFQIATAGNWIWGVSTWDGGDVWGGSSSSVTWTELQCDVVQIQLEHGVDIEQGVFVNPSGNKATILMTSADYDPFTHATIHAGVPVRIQVFPLPDSDPTLQTVVFEGTVESYSTQYDAFGNNLITINAVDFMQQFLNTPITSWSPVTSFPTADDIISELVTTYWPTSLGFTNSTLQDFWYVSPATWTNTTVGEIIRDCLKANQGAFYNTIDNYQAYLSAADLKYLIEYAPNWDFSTVHSLAPEHICMTDLNISADSKNLPTEIILTLDGGTVMTERNQDAYDLYGAIALQTDVRISTTTGGQAWLDNLQLSTRLRQVKQLTFDAIERPGQLRSFVWADQLFTVAQVTYDLGGMNVTDPYFITKQTDLITPDAWTVSVELWRGV